MEQMQYVAVDLGKDLKLPCFEESAQAEESILPHSEESSVMWVREGREEEQINRLKIEPNGVLELLNVSVDDAGNYSCSLDDSVKVMVNVKVRSML